VRVRVCEMLVYDKINNEVRLLSAMQLYVPVKYLRIIPNRNFEANV